MHEDHEGSRKAGIRYFLIGWTVWTKLHVYKRKFGTTIAKVNLLLLFPHLIVVGVARNGLAARRITRAPKAEFFDIMQLSQLFVTAFHAPDLALRAHRSVAAAWLEVTWYWLIPVSEASVLEPDAIIVSLLSLHHGIL